MVHVITSDSCSFFVATLEMKFDQRQQRRVAYNIYTKKPLS